MSRASYQIPPKEAKEILKAAIAVSKIIRVDELDCSKSFTRQSTDKTVEEVLEIGLNNSKTHYNFIYRDMSFNGQKDYWDVGFCTICLNPDYFLWIELEPDKGYEIINKFKLKEYTVEKI